MRASCVAVVQQISAHQDRPKLGFKSPVALPLDHPFDYLSGRPINHFVNCFVNDVNCLVNDYEGKGASSAVLPCRDERDLDFCRSKTAVNQSLQYFGSAPDDQPPLNFCTSGDRKKERGLFKWLIC